MMQLDLLITNQTQTTDNHPVVTRLPNGRIVALMEQPPKPESVYPFNRYALATSEGWQYPHIIDRRILTHV